jgi:hypothetical protein
MVYKSSAGSGGSTGSFDAQLAAVNGRRHATSSSVFLQTLSTRCFSRGYCRRMAG